MTTDKIWLSAYPQGVPAEIQPDTYSSLTALLEESFHRYADRDAYFCMGKSLTYREIDLHSQRVAAWLQCQGLSANARVAVMMPNVLQYPIAVAGILRAGYTVVNVNPLYTARELEHQLADSGAEVIFVLENFAATVQQVLPKTKVRKVVIASMGDMHGGVKGMLLNFAVRHIKKMVPAFSIPDALSFNRVLQVGAGLHLDKPLQGHEDIAFLQYTGGTTGVSKGAVLTHRNVIANILQNDAWSVPAMKDLPQGKQWVTVCALPLYHILALNACMMMGARWGALNVLIPNPRDIGGLMKTLSRFKIHFFPGVNTLFNAMLNHPDIRLLDLSELQIALGGGMAVQQAVSDRWQKLTGKPILEGYGLSETSPSATLCPPGMAGFSGTIGLPIPSTEIAILDDDGRHLAIGETGEIAIRGPQVMRGYWNRPDETAKVMTADGFFRSGDIGVMDARGFVKIVDRKKDMILVSGFNVFPNEVEAVVMNHPGVLECACVGIPDANSGEAVKLFVVKKDPALTADDLMAYCKEQMTAYKKPKYIEFRMELPKTNVGKILRRELRDGK